MADMVELSSLKTETSSLDYGHICSVQSTYNLYAHYIIIYFVICSQAYSPNFI